MIKPSRMIYSGMDKRIGKGLFMLLLVLWSQHAAAFVPFRAANNPDACVIKENIPAFPFYQGMKAILPSPGLINRSNFALEGGGAFLLQSRVQRAIVFYILPEPDFNTYLALRYRWLILFPFHSFW